MRASIATAPRASRRLSVRSSGSRLGAGLTVDFAAGFIGAAGPRADGFGLPDALLGGGAAVGSDGLGVRRSGATERTTRPQSVRSSALSGRRSSALMTPVACAQGRLVDAFFLPLSRHP